MSSRGVGSRGVGSRGVGSRGVSSRGVSSVCLVNYYAWSVMSCGVQSQAQSEAHSQPQSQAHVGGEEVQSSLLSRQLASNGYATTLVVGDYGQPDTLQIDGVTIRKTFALTDGLPLLRFLSPRVSRTWSALQRADADVYYTSCAGYQVGLIAAFCRRYKRRFVFRVASDSDCHPAKLLVQHARDKWLYHYGLKRADAVLAQTETQMEMLRENYGIEAKLAGMLVDIPDAVAEFEHRNADVLWLANMRPMKRPQMMLDVAEAMPEMRVTMAGGMLPDHGNLYSETAKRAHKILNVSFLGSVPFANTPQLFRDARVFVNTSNLEGFPNTFLQAWAHGTPVVTTFDPDGIVAREGLGITVDSIDEMKSAIRDLVSAPQRWKAYSARCREYVGKRFHPQLMTQTYRRALFPCESRELVDDRAYG